MTILQFIKNKLPCFTNVRFITEFFISFIFCNIVFSIGFTLQYLIDAVLGVSQDRSQLLYNLISCREFVTTSPLLNFVSAITPSLIFCTAWYFMKQPSWKMCAVLGAISILIHDLALHLIHGEINLILSIICDLLGGPIAGVLCGYLLRCVVSEYQSSDFIRATKRSAIYAISIYLATLLLLSVSYFVIFFPIKKDVILKIPRATTGAYTLKENEGSPVARRKDSFYEPFEKHFPVFNAQSIAVTLDDVIWNVNNIDDLAKLSFHNITNLKIDMYGYEGCQTKDEVDNLLPQTKRKISLTLNEGDSIAVNGGDYKLVARGAKEKKSILYLYNKSVQVDSIDEKIRISQFPEAITAIRLEKGNRFYFSAIPDHKNFLKQKGYMPELAGEYTPASLLIENTNQTIGRYDIPVREACNCKCRLVDINSSKHNGDPRVIHPAGQGYLLIVKDFSSNALPLAKFVAYSKTDIVYSRTNERLLGQDDDPLFITSVASTKTNGELNYGLARHELKEANLMIAGEDLSLTSNNGMIDIRGKSSFVEINGDILMSTLMHSIDPGTFGILLTATLAAFGLFMRSYGLPILRMLLIGDHFPF